MVQKVPSFAREPTQNRAGYNRCTWLFLDKSYLSSRVKYKTRVDCKESAACYTYDELDSYEKNAFARNYIFCALFGMGLYLIIYMFMMMPELNFGSLSGSSRNTRSVTINEINTQSLTQSSRGVKFEYSKGAGDRKNQVFDDPHVVIPVVAVTIFLCATVRSLIVMNLNSYIVLASQTIVLILAILGTIEYNCQLNQTNAYTGGGQFPIALLQAVVEWTGMADDRFRHIFYYQKCQDAYKRMSAINLISEIVNFAFAVRIITL